jgi:hypothetical protein
MQLRKNINRIHFDLQNEFKDVILVEKSEKKFGNHFEVTINESDLTLKAHLSHRNLESEQFTWSYLSNPEDENSVVERVSTTDDFVKHVKDIFQKKRFDSDYLKNKI